MTENEGPQESIKAAVEAARSAVGAAPDVDKKEVATAVVDAAVGTAPAEEKKDVAAAAATAAVGAAPDVDKKEVATAVVDAAVGAAPIDEKKDVAAAAATAAVGAAPAAEKKGVAAAAIDALSSEQRKELLESMWPSESKHRLWIYITGFIVAGVVAVGLALVASGASGAANSIAPSLVVLATGFSSAILGGLLGAYIQK